MWRAARSCVLVGFGLLATLTLLVWSTPSVSAAPNPPPPAADKPPEAQPAAPPVQAAPGEFWVQNFDVTELWSGPNDGAVFFGWLRKFSYLRVERWEGERLY